jgi:prefoldin alpha subunit
MTEEMRQRLQQIYTEQKMAESNVHLIQQRLDLVSVYLSNYRSGLEVLQELEGREKGEEMLMNVGGSIFVRANLADPTIVTRGIGSGVRIEQNVNDAKKALESSIENLEKQYQDLSAEYEKLLTYVSRLNAEFQDLAAKVQGQGQGE